MSRITRAIALASAILTVGLVAPGVVPVAQAQTYEVTTAGSSAQWGVFAAGAYQLAITNEPTGGSVHHYTVKGADSSGNPYAYLYDARSTSIQDVGGNIWIVWNEDSSGNVVDVWTYLSIDSVVGVRGFMGSAKVALNSAAPSAGQNLLAVWSDGSTDTALPASILAAFDSTSTGGVSLTAANTDIRPEDGLFAAERALTAYCGTSCPPSTNTYNVSSAAWSGLGYGPTTTTTGPIGTLIESTKSSATLATEVQPVLFGITAGAADPINTSYTVPSWTTIPVGAAPVIFIANTTSGSSVAAATNISQNQAIYLFSGNTDNPGSLSGGCIGSNVTGGTSGNLNVVLREPTSGTYSTIEYNVIRTSTTPQDSQEAGINPASSGTNPLNQACNTAGGSRWRATGTGDVVSDVNGNSSTLGYTFFSYEAVPTTDAIRYLEYNGADPLAGSSSATYSGSIPSCSSTISSNTEHWCPGSFTAGQTFYNVRYDDSTNNPNHYDIWSTYRLVTPTSSSSSTQYTNNLALVNAAEQVAAFDLPDFIPFEPQCSTSSSVKDDPGLQEYREHFVWSFSPYGEPTSANNGPNLLGTSGKKCSVSGTKYYSWALGGYVSGSSYTEAGGDVGGVVINNFTKSTTSPGATPSNTNTTSRAY